MAMPLVEALLAPSDASEQFMQWMKEQGKDPVPLRCSASDWQEVHLCSRVKESDQWRWITQADPVEWQPLEPPVAAVSEKTQEGISFWTVEGPGVRWALAHPESVMGKVGGEFLAAIPAHGTMIVWRPGNTEVDRVMSVGVAQMYETLDHPVSEWIHRWDGRQWSTWGRAVPSP